jgi:hypothetical protein
MMGLARAYGSDNGSDSDAGPDGNGDDDIPSYGTQFDKRHLQCGLKPIFSPFPTFRLFGI